MNYLCNFTDEQKKDIIKRIKEIRRNIQSELNIFSMKQEEKIRLLENVCKQLDQQSQISSDDIEMLRSQFGLYLKKW